jgi:tRNA-dihydrouridine synthase A
MTRKRSREILLVLSLLVLSIMSFSIKPNVRVKGKLNIICMSTMTMSASTLSIPIPPAKRDLFSVAPMMEYTDRYQRYLQRLLSKYTVLYTEMVTSYALVHSADKLRFLQTRFDVEEPLVLQLGGSDPEYMRKAARIAYDYGYREFNINCGCPSEKVAGAGCFGAALMLNPPLVAELVDSIASETNCPTTVKCRIGVDNEDSYEGLVKFIDTVKTQSPVRHVIIHARKALLGKKFTPADNRKIPPLRYEYVHRLVKDFPDLRFTINGGIQTITEAQTQINEHGVHGVMVGRAVTNQPFHWRNVDSKLYGVNDPSKSFNITCHTVFYRWYII